MSRLYQRNGVWWSDTRDLGGDRSSLRTRDKKVAGEAHRVRELALMRGEPLGGTRKGMTLDEAVRRALGTAWRGYARKAELVVVLDGIKEHFKAHTPLRSLTAPVIREWSETLVRGGLSNATANRRLAALSRLLHLGVEWGAIDMVPKLVRLKEKQGRVRFYTREEEVACLVWCLKHDQQLGCLIEFLADTGWRPSEAVGLTRERIHGARAELLPEDQKGRRHTFTPLTPRAQTAIPGFLGAFPSVHAADKRWNALRLAMGWTFGSDLYCWRHTTATRLIEARVPVNEVMEFMRHRDVRTTMRYVHLVGGGQDRAAEALAVAHKAHSDAGSHARASGVSRMRRVK